MDTSLLTAIARQGRNFPSAPPLSQIEIFSSYFDKGKLDYQSLDKRDGNCTRRELLLRYLLLNAVLDQGPDTDGVRLLLIEATNDLYRREIRFLHQPIRLFQELGIAISCIQDIHAWVKSQRASQWAALNQSSASRYSLLLDGAKQFLGYVVFRWGVPLAVPHLLMGEHIDDPDVQAIALQRYLASWPSAEVMSRQLKRHPRYGLGKAIGDKAAHLYAKWVVHTFSLLFSKEEPGWGQFSFEVPFDSNAGRVLFRTGFLLQWTSLDELIAWKVVQIGAGKNGKHYIRVTNLRGKKSQQASANRLLAKRNETLCLKHLKTHRRPPRAVEIQRVPSLLLWGTEYSPGELDDGLMYIGTTFCYNHSNPDCKNCPIASLCLAAQERRDLITDYRT